jgi:general secretion pathway protein K
MTLPYQSRKYKNCPSFVILKNDSGIILIATLWVMVILSILSIGIGRQANLELNLTKHLLGQVKAFSIAWAGLTYAMEQVYLDSKDDESKAFDTLVYCGIRGGSERSAQNLFKEKLLSDGAFYVQYTFKEDEGQGKTVFGLADEERKININSIQLNNIDILSSLIVLLGFEEQVAKQISFSIVDWIDSDTTVSDAMYGAEDDYYLSLDPAYRTKNTFVDSLEELLLVKGMTKDVFQKLKEYITVFPQSGHLKINFDTASQEVLQALASTFTGSKSNTEPEDALSLVEKMLVYRMGEDGVSLTDDDRIIDMNALALNAKEKVLFLLMSVYRTKLSNYLHAHIKGIEDHLGSEATIDAIIQRHDLSIVYWNRK